MRRQTWVPAGAAVLVVVAVSLGVVVLSAGDHTTAAAQAAPANTEQVRRGRLSAVVSQDGTLTYRARPDGSPYAVINQAAGTYTRLPAAGDKVGCGDVLYRVDEHPVVLLCGTVPAFRKLDIGDVGSDVRQLNRNLHELGYDAKAHVHIWPGDDDFTVKTEQALEVLQRNKGVDVTGALAGGDAVFLPEAVRIAKVSGEPGGPARAGAPVLSVTSDRLHVQVDFDPSQQGRVKPGDRAQITLPGNTTVTGRVAGFGRIAQAPAGRNGSAADATIPTYISLDDPSKARGLDRAPVGVQIITAGVDDALSVPVTALVGKSGGGYAVEVARAGGQRELVAVTVGLFDTADGRVQVEGDLRAGRSGRGAVVVSGERVLELDAVTKVYGEQPPVCPPCAGCPSPSSEASWRRSSDPPGRASPRCCTSWGRSSGPPTASSASAGSTPRGSATASCRSCARGRSGSSSSSSSSPNTPRRARTSPTGCSTRACRPPSATGAPMRRSNGSASPSARRSSRPSSPAGSASGWRSREPSSGVRRSSSPTSRPGTSTAPPAHRSWRSSASSTPPAPRSS